jgi:hypothetical protein
MNALCAHSGSGHAHNCLVVTRRRLINFFRLSYWVVCIYCDEMYGPLENREVALKVMDAFNARG